MVLDKETLVREKYRITRLIGDGGMGAVYEAEHLILKVPVALKFLHAELAERPGLTERFLREARVSATIQSPHVTRVTDVDKTDAGMPFLVMELLRGRSLQHLLDERRSLPEQTCIDYALQILSGLEAAHALGVVHRDLKPDNVFLTEAQGAPVLKLIDFGIAKLRDSEEFKQTLTRAGAMMGTPEYMAPEQLYSAASVDARADIFSLGVILYEMLCGHRPVEGEDATEIVGHFVAGDVVPLRKYLPGTPDALDRIVHKAIQPQPEDRFASAYEMRRALATLARDVSPAAQIAANAPEHQPGFMQASSAASAGTKAQSSRIPETLPPDESLTGSTEDDPPLPEGTGTQNAAPLDAAQLRAHASAMAPPPSPAAQQAAEFKVRPAAIPTNPSRTKGGPNKFLVVSLLLLLVGIGAAMAVLLLGGKLHDEPSPSPEFDGPPPLRTIEAEVGTNSPTPESTPTTPPDKTPEKAPDKAPPRPAPTKTPGASQPSPSGTQGPPPLSFPSALPPLPSGLPPLPSGFPTALPSFLPPLPGFTPAPANTQDAGN